MSESIKSSISIPYINNTPSYPNIASNIEIPDLIVPHILESEFGESLDIRTRFLPNFKDVGPVDLVHISKHQKSLAKDIGQYHYVIGLDVSSTDAVIAYLLIVQMNSENLNGSSTTLNNSASHMIKATNKHPKIATYCSWNCFSKGDLRIRAEFPGSITVSFVFADSNKISLTDGNITDEIWLETYVSSLIRSMLISDDLNRQLPGMCKFNPVQSRFTARAAVRAMIELLPKGNLTGCKDTVLAPTIQQNHLIDSLLKLVQLTNLYDFAIQYIEELYINNKKDINNHVYEKQPQFVQLPNGNSPFLLIVIKMLLLSDNEIEAVKRMYEGIKNDPRDALLLLEQAKYLIEKDRPDLAIISAKKAVDAAPTEYECWKTLVEIHLILNNFEQSLSILNSLPMYSPRPRDYLRFNARDELNLKQPFEGCIDEIWEAAEYYGPIYGNATPIDIVSPAERAAVDPLLLKIFNSTRLSGTFQSAYDLLANLTRSIGWDNLLKLRSNVFVMEDEIKDTINSNGNNEVGETEDGDNLIDSNHISNMDKFKKKGYVKDVVLMWESERASNVIKHSALEWLLIGLASIRCHHFESGIAALKTSVNAKFNPFGALKLLELYDFFKNSFKFKALHQNINYFKKGDFFFQKMMDDIFFLKLLIKYISWNSRWYGEFLPDLLIYLKKNFIEPNSCLYVKSVIAGEFSNSERVFSVTDRNIDFIELFENQG
ncbi:hypothetical protein PACTADRAFT_919 [Pachysolen tannophilus NRRL Y-2460]|uniref:Bud site selection protein 7 n=1 Tax=Pachysolen tannophilus NRRL Y-2460 TaxID=669874 RepID=A0A1E4U374_PACTA|nr:hypothetical protein PACTADRAFT_919 [Pachysolen tannophilus NRRL Y-2460]